MGKASSVAIRAAIIRETARAYFCNIDGCHTSAWLPKSQLRNVRLDVSVGGTCEYTGRAIPRSTEMSAEIPAWLWDRLPRTQGPIPFATRPV